MAKNTNTRRGIFGRRKPRHRYASHQIAIPGAQESIKHLSTKTKDWQEKILKLADIVPEVMSGYSFVHNTMDRVTLEIERYDRAENQWVRETIPEIRGIERRLNQSYRMGRTAALTHLVEEAYILIEREIDQATGESRFEFETLSPKEVKSKGNIVEILDDCGDKEKWEPLPNDATIVRVYTPDPRKRGEAGGPHKALVSLLETMAIELLRDQADAVSVLAGNGILLIPTEILPDESDDLDVPPTPGSRRGFEDDLENSMTSTIADRTKGEAVVPIVLYGPGENLKDVRHVIPTRSETPADSKARMDGYITRYARDIDLPPQVILGLGDANHWSDWKVDENTWAYHLEPRAQRIADALYAGLVGPIIRNLGFDDTQYRLVPNSSGAVAKQDQSRSAEVAYRVGAITPESYVEAIGLDTNDLRDDAEENLLILTGNADEAQLVGAYPQSSPDRTAAASLSVPTILRQASRVANQQQRQLHARYSRVIRRIAEDAARDGRNYRKDSSESSKTAAADAVKFEGYEPGVYFVRYQEELEAATNDQLFAYLRRIATLTGLDYQELRGLWAGEFQQRAAAVSKQAQALSESVSRASYASGKPSRVADNVIRTLTSTASGGSNQSNGAAGNTQRPTHPGEDPVMRDALQSATFQSGGFVTQYTWTVGSPDHPFPEHQDLDGRQWYSWEEYDSLDNGGDDPATLGSVYFPGDHNGCQCDYDIEFVPASEAQ